MRGKDFKETMSVLLKRITPAYAGKSNRRREVLHRHGDHPRICGEKRPMVSSFTIPSGSPPHMRGKVIPSLFGLNHERITPAYAGKRLGFLWLFRSHWDHPRICGEKRGVRVLNEYSLGSPPHMRGKVTEHRTHKAHHGITPAYAGKSLNFPTFSVCSWDHPRICGEKWLSEKRPLQMTGSPPHMRGKDVKLTLNAGQLRITPAYAGKS